MAAIRDEIQHPEVLDLLRSDPDAQDPTDRIAAL
jgi:hypothetical protein